MKLYELNLFEERCYGCGKHLTASSRYSLSRIGRALCQPCGSKSAKEKERTEEEEFTNKENEENAEINRFFFSQQTPDRGYDKDRGTPGWLMGEPSPGRSF